MEILESACAIVNTILCCKQKSKTVEETESIKIDKETLNNKLDGAKDFRDDETTNGIILKLIIRPVLIDETQHPVKPPRAPKRMCVQESKRRKTISINNSKRVCNHHIKFAEHSTCEQQQQQNKTGIEITIADDQHCSDFLPHRNEDLFSKISTDLSKSRSVQRLLVITSTQFKNSQSNCSSAIQDRGKQSNTSIYNNSYTSTEYKSLRRKKLEEKKNNNELLTSTKVDSSSKDKSRSSFIRKMRKNITAIFCRYFNKTSSNLNK